ncbi:MAG: 4'-phosphopantetheinyl transferase family protein [Cytophagaceae bacterium]
MPVFLTEKINENCSLSIWKIVESGEDLIRLFKPFPRDLEKFNSISHPAKRAECVASRLALKEILKATGTTYTGISYDQNRKPYLSDSREHISFSHSGEYACALLHKSRNAAVDLEMIREKLTLVSPRILSAQEMEDASNDLKKMAVYWTCKEVVYKFHAERSLNFRKDIFIEPFSFDSQGECLALLKLKGLETRLKINYRHFGNYIIAYTYEN